MKLTLIRHSLTIQDFSKPIVLWQLSDEGRNLAKKLSQTEVIKNLDIIYSSLQTKALETALILAKDNYISIEPQKDLGELTSITNAKIDNYKDTMHDFYSGKIERINSGETIEEGKARFNKTIETIIINNPDKNNIGIVSHVNILSIFSAQFCEKSEIDLHGHIQMPDFAVLDWETKKFIRFWNLT